MSRLWYMGDSWIDPKNTGRREYKGMTSWCQDLPQALGVQDTVDCSAAGSSPDYALTQLFKQQHQWSNGDAEGDYLLVSISDFARLNLKCLPPVDQHSTPRHKKSRMIFKNIHNGYWDFSRTFATVMLLQSLSVYWHRVLVITPFGIPRSGEHFSRADNQRIVESCVHTENFWWFPRYLFFYDNLSHNSGPSAPDPRPNHITGEHNTAMFNSAVNWFKNGKRKIYKPYVELSEPYHGYIQRSVTDE